MKKYTTNMHDERCLNFFVSYNTFKRQKLAQSALETFQVVQKPFSKYMKNWNVCFAALVIVESKNHSNLAAI